MKGRNFIPFPGLKTERLILRQLVETDANQIFALRSNEDVNRYLDRKPAESLADAQAFIWTINKNIQKNESVYWAITLIDADKLIGTICLFDFSDDDLKAEIGYELLPEFQGKSIMQEAASTVLRYAAHIGLTLIKAHSHVSNQPSGRLLKRLDFTEDGPDNDNTVRYKLVINLL